MRLKQRHAVLALLCVLGAILYIDRVCISLALPAIQKELDIGPERVGWVGLAFSLGYGLFEIPSGHLGDRFGARLALSRITVWWSLFTALTGAAFGFGSLVVMRFLFGAGEAGAWPNVSSIVSKFFPARSRGRAMGWFGAATTVGGGLSPLLVIPIQQAYGWRASFFVFAAFGVAWAVVWSVWFRDTPVEMGAPSDELAEIAELDPVRPRARHGLRWAIALRRPSIWALCAMMFANIYCGSFAVFWLPSYLAKARSFTDGELKWLAVTWMSSGLGNLAGGALSDAAVRWLGRRTGRRVVGVSGMLAVGLLYALLPQTSDKTLVIVLLSIQAMAFGVIQANCMATCIDIGGDHVGSVTGTMNMAGQLGGGLSVVSFGHLLGATGSWDVPIAVMSVVGALGAAPWRWIDASLPLVAEERPAT